MTGPQLHQRADRAELARRWRERFPQQAKECPDPRTHNRCRTCNDMLAWHGYDDQCGWCHETPEPGQ